MTNCKIAERLMTATICPAADARNRVPSHPGYYTIFIDKPEALPGPFRERLVQKNTDLIYIGIATVHLYERLVQQDLLHRQPSTFFRGIGALLGYRPEPGSLIGRKNKKNYQFSVANTQRIIDWSADHLSVRWLQAAPALEEEEALLICKRCADPTFRPVSGCGLMPGRERSI